MLSVGLVFVLTLAVVVVVVCAVLFCPGLSPHVPWVHAHQMPSTFNTLLATQTPENFWSSELELIKTNEKNLVATSNTTTPTPAPKTMYLLQKYRSVIMAEYSSYEKDVATNPLAVDRYDKEHEDSWMSKTSKEESWWAYLRLRSAGGVWDEELCRKYFTKTCTLLKDIPEVNAIPSNAKCEGYCPSQGLGSQRSTGMISFYRLAPGKSVKEHSGGDNHRLKCHLVLMAPTILNHNTQDSSTLDPAAAYIQVSDTKRMYSTGDTFCFDDSFYHSVHNGGGTYQNITRVVLDVAVWHPKLYSM
tara:strand:+ start:67 stop:972 length:906 start_codon:yes stop_codon:yes gene_type:complete